MNKYLMFLVLIAAGVATLPGRLAAELTDPMRGKAELGSTGRVQDHKPWIKERPPIDRNFIQQPPLIPHEIDGYIIDASSNKCLTCHSWDNYRQARSTKISLTHFRDRDGKELSNVSAQRYFCTQCHVPQVEAEPLVGNRFKPVEALR